MPSSASASGTFGVTSAASGKQLAQQRGARVVLEQPRAALRHHHRVDHERRDASGRAPRAATASMIARGGEHAGLGGVDADVGGHGVDLRRGRTRG